MYVTGWENAFQGQTALGKELVSEVAGSAGSVTTSKAASCLGKCITSLGDLRSHPAHFTDVSRGSRTCPLPLGLRGEPGLEASIWLHAFLDHILPCRRWFILPGFCPFHCLPRAPKKLLGFNHTQEGELEETKDEGVDAGVQAWVLPSHGLPCTHPLPGAFFRASFTAINSPESIPDKKMARNGRKQGLRLRTALLSSQGRGVESAAFSCSCLVSLLDVSVWRNWLLAGSALHTSFILSSSLLLSAYLFTPHHSSLPSYLDSHPRSW